MSFDPAVWLRRFKDAGGSYIVTREPRILIGYALDEPMDGHRCDTLLGELSACREHREAVRLYLIGRP